MIFAVTRTCTPWESQPCDEAVNHGPDPANNSPWRVELTDLDALMAFVAKHGNIVVFGGTATELPVIEIYDNWRE